MEWAYYLDAVSDISSDFAPVQTIFPDAKMRAVVLGSLILMMAAAKRLGLYSTFWQWWEIWSKFNWQPRFAVDTIFCNLGSSPLL